ncbi:uncharacterized protein LOC135692764 [Rhopilema esculentum]|uniref:uncharacterized protein LOC135692764 n=1 Tax=Rhopilema esculentum TaxID=499914 RepID=UPI0031DD1376|eukprot:gene1966-17509_t
MAVICYTLLNIGVAPVHLTIWITACVLIAMLLITVNTYLIVALHKTKQMNTSTNKLVKAMSLSDITVGVLAFPLLISLLYKQAELHNCHLHHAVQYVAISTGYTSFLMLILIAFDRFLHLTKLNAYNKFMNKRKLGMMTLGTAVAAHLIALLITLTKGSFQLQIVLNIGNLLGLIGVNVMYAAIVRKIKRNKKVIVANRSFKTNMAVMDSTRKRTVAAQHADTKQSLKQIQMPEADVEKQDARNMKGNIRTTEQINCSQSELSKIPPLFASNCKGQDVAAINTIKLTLLTMLCLYLPYNFGSLVVTYYRYYQDIEPADVWKVLSVWCYLLLLTNGVMNAIIFVYGNRRLREYTKRLLNKDPIYPALTYNTVVMDRRSAKR